MDIDFELYKIFYHAARSKSFSSAAKQLFISQSAVSQSIAGLERKIGSMLFIRKTKNITLTTEGEILFKHIEQAYNFIKTAEGKIQEVQSLGLGEIRIGVGDTICRYFLIPYLKKFISLYPKIKIKVINRTSPNIIEILKTGQIDFGIVTLPFQDKNIEITDFKEVEDVFVASPKFTELSKKAIPIAELVKYPLLLLQKDSATRQNLNEFFFNKGFTITPEIELDSIELLVEFAKIGLGIAHVLKESIAALVKSSDLFIVKIDQEFPLEKLGVAVVKNVPLSNSSSRFIDILGDQTHRE